MTAGDLHTALLSRRVLRVGLHDSTACPGDEVQGSVELDGGHPFAPVIPVHEDTVTPGSFKRGRRIPTPLHF